MRLTDEGQLFFERAQEVVDAAAEAEAEVARMHATAVGTLRLSVPVSWGQRFLDAVLAQYLGQQPSVEVVVDATDRDVDLIDEGYDLAVRAGELKDSSLMARKLATSRRLVVASPQYLHQRGAPKNPEELRQHECLLYRHQRSGDVWELDGKRGRERIGVHGRLRCNNGDMIAAACVRGTGVAFLPDFIVLPLVKAGELEVVLEQYCRTYLPIHAIYPSRRHLSAKVRLFLDALSVPFKQDL
jgi:DNA-binding transcriptional LysR family regulator